jgi:hypothetical protein
MIIIDVVQVLHKLLVSFCVLGSVDTSLGQVFDSVINHSSGSLSISESKNHHFMLFPKLQCQFSL